MALAMNQLHGLGQAEIVAAILGPVVTGGADIYRTHQEGKISKEELKQRQREFVELSRLQQEQLEARERSDIVRRHSDLQQRALSSAWWQRNLPLFIGGGLLITLAIAAATRGRR